MNHNETLTTPLAAENQTIITPERETTLRSLLDGHAGGDIGNFDTALKSGLLDIFYFDPSTGDDGIQHILSGQVSTGPEGATIAEGFHHEPSADWGVIPAGKTYITHHHLDTANSKLRWMFQRSPYEPFKARSVIDGHEKVVVRTSTKTGLKEVVPADTSMFPSQYDPLAVLQTIRIAYENQIPDSQKSFHGNRAISVEGLAPMLDGTAQMKIRMALDPKTKRIVTAMPIVKSGGVMDLGERAIRLAHLGL